MSAQIKQFKLLGVVLDNKLNFNGSDRNNVWPSIKSCSLSNDYFIFQLKWKCNFSKLLFYRTLIIAYRLLSITQKKQFVVYARRTIYAYINCSDTISMAKLMIRSMNIWEFIICSRFIIVLRIVYLYFWIEWWVNQMHHYS